MVTAWFIASALAGPQPLELSPSGTDASVDHYVAEALAGSPEVRAAFHRWEADVHRVARAHTLPEPVVQFGVFLQSVETRVGPQQARVSVQQAFPWPTKLTAGGKAASAQARAAQAQLEAASLQVALQVEQAFWTLWEVRQARALHEEHLQIVDGLSQSARARVEVGTASLADLQQVDLTRARLEDAIRSMQQQELRAEAALRAVLGRRDDAPLPTVGPAPLAHPDEADLTASALAHPLLVALEHQADAADERARARASGRLPSFTVGADWILTGQGDMPDMADSGKDAIVAGVGITLPLWQGTYGHEIAAERSVAAAQRADQQRGSDHAIASLQAARSMVLDSERRATVLTTTLLPQAQAAYESVLGSYTVGRSGVAQALLAQRDLLDLSVSAITASADHQRAWAQLDLIVGHEVARDVVPSPEPPTENTP